MHFYFAVDFGQKICCKEKIALSVDLGADDLQREIEATLNATTLTIPSAANITVRASTTLMEEEKTVENVVAILEEAFKVVPGNFSNVQSINLKIATSPAFPIYCCLD